MLEASLRMLSLVGPGGSSEGGVIMTYREKSLYLIIILLFILIGILLFR